MLFDIFFIDWGNPIFLFLYQLIYDHQISFPLSIRAVYERKWKELLLHIISFKNALYNQQRLSDQNKLEKILDFSIEMANSPMAVVILVESYFMVPWSSLDGS